MIEDRSWVPVGEWVEKSRSSPKVIPLGHPVREWSAISKRKAAPCPEFDSRMARNSSSNAARAGGAAQGRSSRTRIRAKTEVNTTNHLHEAAERFADAHEQALRARATGDELAAELHAEIIREVVGASVGGKRHEKLRPSVPLVGGMQESINLDQPQKLVGHRLPSGEYRASDRPGRNSRAAASLGPRMSDRIARCDQLLPRNRRVPRSIPPRSR